MTPVRLLRRLVGLVLLFAVIVVLAVSTRIWWVARQDDRPRSDAIVVLGASQFNGTPSQIFQARLEHARTLFVDRVSKRIITVGGKLPADRTTEADAGKSYLVSHGVPASAVTAIAAGNDTLRSVRLVDGVMNRHGWSSAVIVTDPWHSYRARSMARDVGIDAETSPARSGPAVRTRSTQIRYIARETVAFLYYKILGRSSDAGPDAR